MIDINKKYRTRGGFDVTILTTERGGNTPYVVVGLLHEDGEADSVRTWTSTGKFFTGEADEMDLVIVPPYEPEPGDIVWAWDRDQNSRQVCVYIGVNNDNPYIHSVSKLTALGNTFCCRMNVSLICWAEDRKDV